MEHSYDFKGKVFKDPKTAAGVRKVPIAKRYLDELKEWRKSHSDSLLVFPCGTGHISESEHECLWNTLLDAINGITISSRISSGRTINKPKEAVTRSTEFTSHDLRHTFATNCAAKNVDLKTLQYIMGHEKAETLLDIYAHFSAEAWNAAAAILDNDTPTKGDKKQLETWRGHSETYNH